MLILREKTVLNSGRKECGNLPGVKLGGHFKTTTKTHGMVAWTLAIAVLIFSACIPSGPTHDTARQSEDRRTGDLSSLRRSGSIPPRELREAVRGPRLRAGRELDS